MTKIGVIGAGFVGGAVINAFKDKSDLYIVDENPDRAAVTFDELVAADPVVIFICVPTPAAADGDIDPGIAYKVLTDLDSTNYEGIVIVKSTISPGYVTEMTEIFSLRIVYNPEFLTESNAHEDFKNPSMQILGGKWDDCEEVERIYLQYSDVKIAPTFKTDIVTASLLKYTINSWLATKVVFMNELNDLHDKSGADSSWDQFTDMLCRDPRIGNSHLQVPGPDGRFGFGGHCFPKDTSAFLKYAESLGVNLSVLTQAVKTNNDIR